MKIKLLTYFILYSITVCIGQSGSTESVNNYYEQAKKLTKTNQDEALSILQIGLDLANKIEHIESVGDGYALKASILSDLGDYGTSKINHIAALKIRHQLKDSCKIGETYKNLAYLYNQTREHGQALIYLDSAEIVLSKGCFQQHFLGRTYIQKGAILSDLDRLTEAIPFFQQAKEILKNNDYEGYIIANENLGRLYYYKEEFIAAKNIFLTNYDFYQKNKDTASLAQISNSLGATFYALDDFNQSEFYLNQSINFSKIIKNNLYLADALLSLGSLVIELGDTVRAEAIKTEIEQIIESTGGIEEKLDLAYQSVDFYDMVGLYKEKSQFQEKVIMLKDSINILDQDKLLNKELAKLGIAQKEADIQAQRFYIVSLALGLLALTFIVFLIRYRAYKEKITHQNQIRAKQEQIRIGETQIRKGEEETRKKVIEASFQVKQTIHKKLHDDVSNPLSVAAKYIESVIEDPAQIDDLETANQIVNMAYDTSRKIAHELLPFKIDWVDRINLSLGGLERAKNIDAVIHFNRKNINHKTFNSEKGAKVAAIIGNLLVNVEKHADAQQVLVDIRQVDNQVVIKVEDDGIGFDTNQPTGIGLLSIRSNIDALQGTFLLDSIIGKGTKATVFIPVK